MVSMFMMHVSQRILTKESTQYKELTAPVSKVCCQLHIHVTFRSDMDVETHVNLSLVHPFALVETHVKTHTYVLWKDMSHTHRHGTTWRTRFRSRRCDQFRDTIGHLTYSERISSAQTNQACAIAPQTTRAPRIHVWTIVKMNAR